MQRYDICEGDRTTAGGTVKAGSSSDSLGQRAQAYALDPVWCPACKTMGKIVCIGARLPTSGPDGREAALSDDLCVCRCDPSPRLIAAQNTAYTTV